MSDIPTGLQLFNHGVKKRKDGARDVSTGACSLGRRANRVLQTFRSLTEDGHNLEIWFSKQIQNGGYRNTGV